DLPSWLTGSEASKGSVAIEGVLFAHPDASRVYFMSEASGPGVRFELHKSDILDAVENKIRLSFFDKAFDTVRIVLKLDAVVTRVSVHLASGLVEYPQHSITNVAGERMSIKNTVVASVLMR